MKLNMICVKFHQKFFKNLKKLNFGLLRFLGLKKPKKLGFSKPFSSLGIALIVFPACGAIDCVADEIDAR